MGAVVAPIKAVLFDAVGTLIHPDPSVTEVYFAAGQRFGSKLSREAIQTRFKPALRVQDELDAAGNPPYATSEARESQRWRAIVAEVFEDVPESDELFTSLWHHFSQPQHWRIDEPMLAACLDYQQAGVTVGIASNFDGRLETICEGHPRLQAIAHRFVSSKLGFKKPGLPFFRAIERTLGLAPQEILLVGDDEVNDYRAALHAGWRAQQVQRRTEGSTGNAYA